MNVTPLLAFLITVAVVFAGTGLWLMFFNRRAKSVGARLKQIGNLRDGEATRALAQTEPVFSNPLARWLLSESPWAKSLETMLMRAGSKREPYQVMANCAALTAIALLLLGGLIGLPTLQAILISCIVGAMPVLNTLRKAHSRLRKVEDQLPDALDFLTRALRSGNALTQAINMAGDELPAPIGEELKITFDQLNFGLPFDTALQNLITRVPSNDLAFLVTALLIQRDAGGNLTELFDNLAEIMRERAKLYGKVRTLSAEGRFSAVLLTGMPFAMAIVLTLINRDYMWPLWTTPTGHNVVGTGLVMIVIGFMAIWKITKIKV